MAAPHDHHTATAICILGNVAGQSWGFHVWDVSLQVCCYWMLPGVRVREMCWMSRIVLAGFLGRACVADLEGCMIASFLLNAF